MNLKYYEVFTRVYERMNMSIVAEELFLSQPAVSRIIRELENHYGIRFFLRHSGRLYRTAGGEKFYRYAKELLACEDRLQSAIAEQKIRRKVVLGASPTVATYYLPSVLDSYAQANDELDIRLFSNRLKAIEEHLLDSRMDVAIVEGQVRSWELTSTPLFEDELVLISSRNAAPPTPSEPIPLLVRDAGDLERHQFEQALRQAGVDYTIQGEFVDLEAIKRFTQQGLGIGVVPRGSIFPEDGLTVLSRPGFGLTAQFFVAYHRNKFVFPELVTLIDHIRTCLGTPAKTSPEEGTSAK